ncbi:hypothetical protein BLL37_08270 [Pseudomonas azotoformans]|uniref:DUF1330 domain-containing protein n=1 Tax=Pseudomonas azotoformans TaxID=47878 RepID=A0A1V2JNB2_PSEAZ|nr:DUF1330 domain-containing protein [Pseudomonas azotoformans]OIN46951.1 hypothetical protein BFL39_17605 [Pseudomonas azotoformans]ONH46853.1 hypothetical protein BLL37_08270 [Pseudomonas azotoformans]SDM87950.1 Uncharacterized conserved protein, DUF1330 family [Pseudomonas azotoformans]
MKAYWIAHVDVADAEQYTQYTCRAPAAFALYGGKILARGGRSVVLEGGPGAPRNVVIEFESYERAVACYESAEYQEAKAHREGAGLAQIIIVEGLAP